MASKRDRSLEQLVASIWGDYEIRRSKRRNHYKVTLRAGPRSAVVFVSATPSDSRGMLNAAADLRAAARGLKNSC